MVKLGLVTVGMFLAVVAMGRDITTLDGKTYKNVKISGVTPAGFDISYTPSKGGLAIIRLKFKNLPESIQKEFNYNPEKAAAFEKRVNYYQQQSEQKQYKKHLTNVKKEQARDEARATLVAGRKYVMFKAIALGKGGTIGWIQSPKKNVTTGLEGKGFLIGTSLTPGNCRLGYIYPVNGSYEDAKEGTLSCYATTLAEAEEHSGK